MLRPSVKKKRRLKNDMNMLPFWYLRDMLCVYRVFPTVIISCIYKLL